MVEAVALRSGDHKKPREEVPHSSHYDDVRARRSALDISEQLDEMGFSVKSLKTLSRKVDSRNFSSEIRRAMKSALRGPIQT